MQIRAGYELIYECPQPTPMVLMLNIHHTRAADMVVPDRMTTDPFVPYTAYRDGFGNWCTRMVAPAGRLRLTASALLHDTGEPEPIAQAEHQHAVEDLPEESLVYLLGSRYCETDRLMGIAWDLFGAAPTGARRIQAICDYVHNHIAFDYQAARSTRTAWEALEEGTGVCRDYAHLAIAFCRCMNIPARYCTGYLGDMVRGLSRRALAHVRSAKQRADDRPRAHRPRTRCNGRGHQQHVRPQFPGGVHRVDGRGHVTCVF